MVDVPFAESAAIKRDIPALISGEVIDIAQTSSMSGAPVFSLAGFATITQESGFSSNANKIHSGVSTIAELSGVSAIGSLKWENQTVANTTYTTQTPATTTWTNQTPSTTNWTDIAA